MIATIATTHTVSQSVMWGGAGILAMMILSLAMEEKIHAKKSLIVITFALLSIIYGSIAGILPLGPSLNAFGEEFHLPPYISGIDWEVIAIILGSSLFVDVTSRSGVFSWSAISLTRLSKGNPRKLLIYYCILTVVFSGFLNNVTAMIMVGSLSVVSLKKLGKEDLLPGFLLLEGLLTNIGGLLTLISSVPNIIIGTKAGISFVDFFIYSLPYVVVTTIATIMLGIWRFKIPGFSSKDEKLKAEKLLHGFKPEEKISSKGFFYFSIFSFVALVALFATVSIIPYLKDLGTGFIALFFGFLCAWRYKCEIDEFYQSIDWDLLFFFCGLFVVIGVMEHAGVLKAMGNLMQDLLTMDPSYGSISMLWSSGMASAVTDNIPLAAVLAKILGAQELASDAPMWWSVVFGSNLGGNITPIGSASTVVAVTIMAKEKIKMSFGKFIITALPFALLQLILATFYILVV